MAEQEHPNRSTTLSPEMAAFVNTMVSSSVEKAVASIFAALAPTLKDMALTPEKIVALNTPYKDPLKTAREARESLKSKQDEALIAEQNKRRKENCLHAHKNGIEAINIVHNFHDRQPRGTCVLCGDWIHPNEWRIGPPTPEYPSGKAYMVPAHKDYARVMRIEMNQG